VKSLRILPPTHARPPLPPLDGTAGIVECAPVVDAINSLATAFDEPDYGRVSLAIGNTLKNVKLKGDIGSPGTSDGSNPGWTYALPRCISGTVA
jgi:hypothetical protein